MRTLRAILIVAIVGAAPVANLSAQDEASRCFRFGAVLVSPTGELTEGSLTVEADSATGVDLGFEVLVSDKLGVEIGLAITDHDLDASAFDVSTKLGSVSMMPVSVGANFHLGDSENFDFYLGPVVSYVLYDDIEVAPAFAGSAGPDEFPTEDGFGYGAAAGFDVPFGERWALTTGIDYMLTSIELDEPDSDQIDVDPWSVRLGLAYRY